MRTSCLKVLTALPLVGFLWACTSGEGGGGSPFEPASAPTVSAIEPAEAAPGDRITIRGEFGAQASQASVAIGGMQAEVKSRSATAIVAVVPEQAPGAVTVVVTVGDLSSPPFAFRVAAVPLPVITGIEPAQARPGERITIVGTHLEGPRVSVTVGGKPAAVMSLSPTAVVVVVPDVGPGTLTVILTARDRTSNPVAYELLQATPVIVAVAPNPTRTDLELTVSGRYLDGGELKLFMDGSPVEVASRNGPLLVARLPVVTRVGTHSLEVQVGEERSAPFAFQVDDFNVTGAYDVLAVVVAVGQPESHLCPILPAKGTFRTLSIRLIDHRPRLQVVMGDAVLNGNVESNGRFSATSSSGPLRIFGNVARRQNNGTEVYEIDVRIDHPGIFGICGWQEHARGIRR